MAEKYEMITRNGYDFGEVTSAMQKSIRRGDEDGALYWAVELDLSNYGEYAWKRLRIITSEDISIAAPMLPAVIHALYENWLAQRAKKDPRHRSERMFMVHAVMLLARAKKCRIVDNATISYYEENGRPGTVRPVPDFALDKHTRRGKMMKRGFEHFFAEGVQIANAAEIEDVYAERAKLCKMGEKEEPPDSLFD